MEQGRQPGASAPPSRTVLVVGAGGFIGGYLVAALRRHGWHVLRGVRIAGRQPAADERHCDLARMLSPDDWIPLLQGVDAVVNAAGILREQGTQTFEAVHAAAPLALAKACVETGVSRFVQVSALGIPEDGGFVASKHRFDEALLHLPLDTVILRPSVVYSTSGSYGGTSLLRALAAFPGIQPLPGDGHWQVQPVAAEDLGKIVARAVENPVRGVYQVAGPEPMSLREYQRRWRRWLRIPGERVLTVPEWGVSAAVRIMEVLGRGPVGETMWRMLRRGNVAAPDMQARLQLDFDIGTRSLSEALAATPSQVQDRWHAQLYFIAPALRISVALLWLLSALAGWLTPAAQIEALTTGSWLQDAAPAALARSGAVVDALLGLWLLSGWRPRVAVAAMLALLLVYTLVFGLGLPALWLDPLGGLAKNLVLLPTLAVLWVVSDRR